MLFSCKAGFGIFVQSFVGITKSSIFVQGRYQVRQFGKKGARVVRVFSDQSNVVGTPASGVADDGWLRLADTRHRWFEPP